MPDIYFCDVVESERLTDYAYAISVQCGGSFFEEARAGQFLMVKCGEERLLRRPFGICNVSGSDIKSYRFVFEVKGEGTKWLSNCSVGDVLDVLAPLGNGFTFPEGDIIIVGGGLGTPPMLFAAKSAKAGVTAVLGFRDAGRVMLVDEYKEICDRVYVTTDDGSVGIHGTVTVPLEDLLKSGSYSAVLTCGQIPMMRAVALMCEKYSVPCQVSMEERMGCGVGACLVCACATKKDGTDFMSRVCKDGPVFDATEVVW